jgi:hypothetical protein
MGDARLVIEGLCNSSWCCRKLLRMVVLKSKSGKWTRVGWMQVWLALATGEIHGAKRNSTPSLCLLAARQLSREREGLTPLWITGITPIAPALSGYIGAV